jgi:hypothetical protein
MDHFVVGLTTGLQSVPKTVPHRARATNSSFKFQYMFFPLGPTNSCLHLPPRLPVLYIFHFKVRSESRYELIKMMDVMSTSVCTGLNTFSFIRKQFICVRKVAVHL